MDYHFMFELRFWFIWVGDLILVGLLTVFLILYGLVPFVILPVVVLIDHIIFRVKIKELVALGIPKQAILKEYNHKYWKKLRANYCDAVSNYKKIFTGESK